MICVIVFFRFAELKVTYEDGNLFSISHIVCLFDVIVCNALSFLIKRFTIIGKSKIVGMSGILIRKLNIFIESNPSIVCIRPVNALMILVTRSFLVYLF